MQMQAVSGDSSSHACTSLVLIIIEEHFGPIVKTVAQEIISRGKATRKELSVALGSKSRSASTPGVEVSTLTSSQVRRSLLVLLQQNCLELSVPTQEQLRVSKPKEVEWQYQISYEGVLDRLRFPRFLSMVTEKYGEKACRIVSDLILHGRSLSAQNLQRVSSEIADVLNSNGEFGSPDSMAKLQEELQRTFAQLAQHRIIIPVPPFDIEKLKKSAEPPVKEKKLAKGARPPPPPELPKKAPKRKRGSVPSAQDLPELPLEVMMKLNNDKKMAQMTKDQGLVLTAASSSASAAATTNPPTSSYAHPNEIVGNGIGSAEAPANGDGRPPRGRGRASRARTRGGRASRGRAADKRPPEDFDTAPIPVPAPAHTNFEPMDVQIPIHTDDNVGIEAKQEAVSGIVSDASILWKLGTDELYRWMRREACVDVVRQKKGKIAANLVTVLLESSARTETTKRDACKPMTLSQISSRMRSDDEKDMNVLKVLVDSMRKDDMQMMIKASVDTAWRTVEDEFSVSMGNVIRFLKRKTIHGIISNKYDEESARLLMLLLKHPYMDESQLAQAAILPSKEARARLYKLFVDFFVTYTDVSTNSSFKSDSTTWFWKTDLEHVEKILLERMYQNAFNLFRRIQHEQAEADKIEEEVSSNQLSESEQARLTRVQTSITRLVTALAALNDTIVLFERH